MRIPALVTAAVLAAAVLTVTVPQGDSASTHTASLWDRCACGVVHHDLVITVEWT